MRHSGVVVDLAAGTSIGASTGTDTMSGVNAARGSEFNDILLGNGGGNTLEGRGGNDVLDGRGGNDILNGGTGSDIFAFGSGADGIGDFNRGEGDRIDLRAFAGITGIGNLAASPLAQSQTTSSRQAPVVPIRTLPALAARIP